MLTMTFSAVDTATSALVKVMLIVQSKTVLGVVRSSRTLNSVERGQAVLECIVSDAAVLRGLGAAELLMKMKGSVPVDLLTMMNQGPGTHIRANGYNYHKALSRELITIRRIKDLQWRAVTLTGSAIVAVMVGCANFVSQLAYDAYTAME